MNNLFLRFLRDVVGMFRQRFLGLVLLSGVVAATDGLRMLVAFLLLPFVGVPLESAGPGFLGSAHRAFAAAGIPYSLGPVAAVVISVFILQAVLALAQNWMQGSYTHRYTLEWRRRLFGALARARWQFFLDNSRGQLVNALSQETSRLGTVVTKFLLFLSTALVALAYIGAALFVSVKATLLMMVVGLLIVVFNSLFIKRLMKHARTIVKGNNQMMGVAQEFLGNIKAVKAAPHGFAVESLVARPLQTIFRSERVGYVIPNASRIVAELFVMMALVAGIASASTLETGMAASETLLVMVLFMRAYGKITMTMTSLQQMYVQLPAFEYVSRVYEQAAAAEEEQWHTGADLSAATISEGIRLDAVTVRYGEKAALQDVNLFLPPRSLVALVGSSGAGKTTFVDMLLRLVDASEGRISVADQDIRSFNTRSWRSCFGYVAQELTLVNASLADNIRLFSPDADMAAVRRAAMLAHAHEFIEKLPDGYDTMVGEMGMKISGGQRQRIAVARALIGDPPVLIFDEATSALDSESEARVMEAINEMRASKLVILIAHRLSTVRTADLIVVLEHGRVVEQGKWEALLAARGRFSELWGRLSGQDRDAAGLVGVAGDAV
jgi:ATP-binding cassette subfamily C protein